MSKCPYDHTKTAEVAPEAEAKCPVDHTNAAAGAAPKSEGKCPYMHGSAEESSNANSVATAPPGKKFFEERDWSTATSEDFKAHFTMAYNELANLTAGRKGCEEVAALLMSRLGYTQQELDIVGDDVWLMQGTGNPHIHAKLQPGEFVVDLGSGFGIDALIMSDKVGATGRVVGIDLSVNEVVAALRRANARKLRNLDFRIGDIEEPPFEDASVDVCMSNGGFCLVPDKAKAFGAIYRILKPGGRISISCTVRLAPLDPTKQWPSCMIVFMPVETVEPVLSKIGFVDIGVDMTNSKVDVWDEIKREEKHREEDNVDCTIHRGDPKYAFLKEYDMNAMFARVTIHARKPL